MIIKRREFSRHTPKNLKKYKDYDVENMSKGQRLQALEEEDNTAAKNTEKYAWKKIKKHAGIGAGGGAIIGAALPTGVGAKERLIMAGTGALLGGTLGLVTGDARGRKKAREEGHDRDDRTRKLARRMDEVARKKGQDDDYEYRNNDRIRMRKAEEAARRAEAYAANASYQSSGVRYGF